LTKINFNVIINKLLIFSSFPWTLKSEQCRYKYSSMSKVIHKPEQRLKLGEEPASEPEGDSDKLHRKDDLIKRFN